jgi:hypothetical protein
VLVSEASGKSTTAGDVPTTAWDFANNGIYVAGDQSAARLSSHNLSVDWRTELTGIGSSVSDAVVGGGRLFVRHQFAVTAYG